tara:strand:+ start:350 stop:1180 length:831 start_codon:yes stop_codon:yes gene_type:complete
MPINLFNNPLASIKLGANDILKGYIGNSQIFPNTPSQTTLTIQFVNNTGLSVSSGQLINTLTGVPGQAINNTSIVLAAANSQRLNTLYFLESGDPPGNLSGSTSGVTGDGGTMTVSGTFPNTDKTIVYTLTASVNNLSSLTAIFTGNPDGITGGGSFSAGTYLVGASNSITCRLTGFSSNSAASAAQSYVSQGQSLQPHSGTWNISDSPSFGTSVNSSNQIVCQANNYDNQYKGTAATTVTFGSAGQSAGYSVSISKASGYYIASSSGSNIYMEYS